jgi:spore germination cell wall hydrolase CwlJ-like protein
MNYLKNKIKSSKENWIFGILLTIMVIAMTMTSTSARTMVQENPTAAVPIEVQSVVIPEKEEPVGISPHDEVQLQCLARNAYFEAGNQSDRGMIAVTNVVMNRVRDGRFPKTPCGVINQRSRRVCQFSWVCEGRKQIRNEEVYRRARAAAERVYLNDASDITRGALFYHANYVNPNWRYTPVVTIGAHIFYRG